MNRKFYIAVYLLATFHIVGAIGMILPSTRELFLSLSALNLLFSALIVFAFHVGEVKRLLVFITISGVVGFFVEVIGINTGWPFGAYHYGESLGLKLLGVPLIIGLNWALLTYCTALLATNITSYKWLRILLGALLMVGLDLAIEPVVHALDFWHWDIGYAPAINFVGWYAVALLLQAFYTRLFPELKNRVAVVYYVVVFLFFLALNFWYV